MNSWLSELTKCAQLADFCITMPDSDGSVITDECFEMWFAMIEESDDIITMMTECHPQGLLNMADADGDSLLTFDEFWSVFNQDDYTLINKIQIFSWEFLMRLIWIMMKTLT